MNIGVDIRSLMTKNKTGVGEYAFELLNAIFESDKTNHYYLFANSTKKILLYLPKWQHNNVHVIATRFPNKFLNFALAFKLIKIENLLNTKIDFWFSPNWNFLSLKSSTKHILTIHDLSFEIYPEFYTKKQLFWHKVIGSKKLCTEAEIITVPSENTKRDLINIYNIRKEKIKVIYPGISDRFFANDDQLKTQKTLVQKKYNLPENYFLFLGSIEPRKNIIGVIEAYEKLPSHLTEKFSLIIVGASGWNNSAIYRRAYTSKFKDKIKFFGYVPESEKPAIFSLAHIFIFPSFYEGFGFPVIEAMAIGTPVITSNRSSLSEISEDGAYLINPNSISELTTAIKNLSIDKTLYDSYKKRGKEIASKYTWGKSAQEWLKLIEH